MWLLFRLVLNACSEQHEMGSELLYLIRPDGYIAYKSQPVDGERLLNHLRNIFK